MKNWLKNLILLSLTLFLFQCVVSETKPPKKSPPPWAPAHGHRAKHKYHYYPSSYVYFDIDRKVYFYLEGGRWRMGARLPGGKVVVGSDFVEIDLDTEKPYKHFDEHKKKYPPGQLKKKKKKKGKKWKH